MFGKIFGKLAGSAEAKNVVPLPVAAKVELVPPPPKPVVDVAVWQGKIATANGEGVALLQLANEAPQVELKLAAITAIVDEATLKQAEKAFRDHDRRVHKLAKDKYQQVVRVRETREAAAVVLTTAHELAALPAIPANRLVELDRAWAAVNVDLCFADTVTSYNSLRAQLTEITRYRVENELAQNRWLVQANANTFALMTALKAQVTVDVAPEAEEGTSEFGALASRRAQATAALADAPANLSDKAKAVLDGLQALVNDADAVAARLAFLHDLDADKVTLPIALSAQDMRVDALITGVYSPSDIIETPIAVEAAVVAIASPKDRWRKLAPVQNEALATALEAQFQAWQQRQVDKRRDNVAQVKQGKKDVIQKARQADLDALSTQIKEAHEQLTAGHIGNADKLVSRIVNSQKHMHLDGGFQAKIENLVADHARLKGWQRWSGGLRREDLVTEADALNLASREPKLQTMEHAAQIDKLRERWKELDKLGAAGSQPLWDKFDAALRTAYLPVEAHLLKLKQARQENLNLRRVVIANLNKFPLVLTPMIVEGAPPPAEFKVPDWREVSRTLEAAQTEWRKCGPVEHTVSRSAQQGVLQDWNKALARLEEPLSDVRRIEKSKREKLIAKAQSLVGTNSKIDDIRNLQTQWQTLAKALPLSRNEENALWASFKTATDLVFSKRQEAFDAKQAQFQENATAREALIAQLEVLNDETPALALKRALADVDTQWKRVGEAPRAVVAKLDARYAQARDAAQARLSSFASRAWQSICDSLQAKLAICREVEAGAAGADKADAFAAAAGLPAMWETSLATRFKVASGTLKKPNNRASLAIDETLLRLEMALEMNSPEAGMAARRELKMRDMKAALETRTAAAPMDNNTKIITLIVQALADVGDASATARLDAALHALRKHPCEFAGKSRV